MLATAIPASAPAVTAVRAARRSRDVRLDVFRGLCLVIIFVAHVFDNPWAAWIPARFGFSDATEIFVFCSGMASALAFGRVFKSRGMFFGTMRIAHRCWEVYWAHVGLFLVAVAAMALADGLTGSGRGYVEGLGLAPLLGPKAVDALAGLLTLRWVPPFFDILPMYLVILAMIPVVMFLSGLGKRYVATIVIACWLGASFGLLQLPGEPWGTKSWFFNPFAWQLIFFTGFAFMMGWLPPPVVDRRLLKVAAAIVLLAVPLAWAPLLDEFPILAEMRGGLSPLVDKSRLGVLRYVHFMALAYLAYAAAGPAGQRLGGPVAEVLRRLGQQSLAVFMSGLLLSLVAGVVLSLIGRDLWTVALVNLSGIALLVLIARVVAYFKSAPWQDKENAWQP